MPQIDALSAPSGILQQPGEPLASPSVYGDDRFFVHIRLADDSKNDQALQALVDAGHPLVTIQLRDIYDLGGLFFAWEMATAVAGYFLGINPFDQPDVESAKRLARQLMVESPAASRGASPEFSDLSTGSLESFLEMAQPGDFVAFQAYVWPTAGTEAALQALRVAVRDRYKLAATIGYGPRYLHSTGQLHKGGPPNGLFVQFVSTSLSDVAIPDEAGRPDAQNTFGKLKLAQAQGDAQALLSVRRRVIRFRLSNDAEGDLRKLLREVTSSAPSSIFQPA